jgi:hypothetical protein
MKMEELQEQHTQQLETALREAQVMPPFTVAIVHGRTGALLAACCEAWMRLQLC